MRKVALSAFVLLLMGLTTPAGADDLGGAINAVRNPDLPIDGVIDSFAQNAAQRMANASTLTHSDLAPLLGHCSAVGEVIGWGSNIEAIMNAFAASPGHWVIIQGQQWTHMGTGVVKVGDRLWVAVVFCTRGVSPTTTSPPPPPPATTRPPPPPTTTQPPTTTTTVPPPPAVPPHRLSGCSPLTPASEWRWSPFPTLA